MRATSTSLRFALLLTAANGFLDSYTYLARGGVFANAQTGNVIFFGIDLAHHHWVQAIEHVGPIAAFALGVFVYALIKSGRIDHVLPHPLRWVMATQALVLLAAGCVPLTVPHSYVTVPIAFMAGVQLGLFRNIGDFNYVAIATTGNLMRLVESAFGGVIDKDPVAITAFGIYVRVIGIFAGGAVIGAFATLAWHEDAVWIPAALLALTLALFILDERQR